MARMASRVESFGTTIFSDINDLAAHYGAVNLGQGKPDFDGASEVIQAAIDALQSGLYNQYSPGLGLPALKSAIAAHEMKYYGYEVNPQTQMTITVGATEAIFATIMGLVDAGDEVIVFEPFYDSYVPSILMAGGIPRYCPLRPPDWTFEADELRGLFNAKTRAIIINTPHNPTGKLYTLEELRLIADLCQEYDVIAITDEVYEHLIFEDSRHISLNTLPDMFERTVKIGSLGKTFSFTGWKIGWVIGAEAHVMGCQRARQFISFAVAHPFQAAAVQAFQMPESYFTDFRAFFQARRDQLLDLLVRAGLKPLKPNGGYFIMAEFSDIFTGSDVEFAKWLTREVGVACIPPSYFYSESHKPMIEQYARFAFCKSEGMLQLAGKKLMVLSE